MTYKQFIDEYSSKGLLKPQTPSLHAAKKIIQRASQELLAAKANLVIDEAIAYTVAYLAMLHAGRALMLVKGFRPIDGYQHKTVVEFTSHVLGDEFKAIVAHFDTMRRKRNIFTYEVDITISKTEAKNAIETAKEFVAIIDKAIKTHDPQTELKI